MNFQLTDEQIMLRKMVRKFSASKIEPTAAERDEQERFDREIFDEMAKLGLTGIPWPEKYGGIGSDYVNYVIVIEELSRACASIGVTLSAHISLASWPIFTYGNEQQKQNFLKRLATGKAIGAYALSEPDIGNEMSLMKTTAKADGDEYIINGRKVWVTNGSVADIYVVFAKTEPEANDQGITTFIIEAGTEGFTIGKKERKLGIRSSPTTELIFENCRIPKANRLGAEGEGFNIAMSTLDGGRNGMAAQAVGIAQAALDASIEYAKEREQFGKPIVHNQGISFKLAEMATEIEAARLLTYHAAWLATNGLPNEKASAISKLFAGNVAMKSTVEAVQVFGGYGYMKDYPVERYMRDAKITQIYEGIYEIESFTIGRMLTT